MAISDKDFEFLKHHIVEFISNSFSKVSPLYLIKEISSLLDCERSKVKLAIQSLVFENEIEYTYSFGNSYLEISFNRPIEISKHVTLLPYFFPGIHEPDSVLVRLYNGISFGSGQHPTTRLSIRAIDFLIKDVSYFVHFNNTSALDIGTGNGILAITAILLGIQRALGIDKEQYSVKEAQDNVKLNGLDDIIEISDLSLNCIHDKFSLIVANLRMPTLVEFFPHITNIIDENGAIVISGLRNSEVGSIIDLYSQNNFFLKWRASEKDWSCIILVKNL